MKKTYIILLIFLCLILDIQAQKKGDLDKMQELWTIAGQSMMVEQNFKKSIPNLENIAAYAKETNDDDNWGMAKVYVSYCHLLSGNKDSLKITLDIVEKEIDHLILEKHSVRINADYRFLMGKYYFNRGLYNQAIGYYENALNTLLNSVTIIDKGVINYGEIRNKFSMNPDDLLMDLGFVYYLFGDYSNALECYDMANKISDRSRNARKYNSIGLAYLDKGEPEKAIESLREAQNILGENPKGKYKKETLSLVYKNIGYYFNLNNQLDSCNFYIDKALSVETKDEFKIKIYHQYLIALKEFSSEDKLNEIFNIIEGIAGKSIGYYHPDMAKSYRLKGDVYAHQKKYIQADRDYNTAINILRGKKKDICDCEEIDVNELNDKRQAIEIIHQKALALFGNDEGEASQDCYQLLHELTQELQRKYILHEDSKYFFAEKTKEIYEDAIAACAALGDEEKAYFFSQSSRSMLLLEQVQDKNAILAAGLPKDTLSKGQVLKFKINEYQKNREEAILLGDVKGIEEWGESLFVQNKLYEDWMKGIEKNYPTYYRLKYELPEISMKELKKNLRKKESTLVEYFIGREKLYIFILDGEKIKMEVEEIDGGFEENISRLRESLSQPNYEWESFDNYTKAGYGLYEKLLKKSIDENLIQNKNLIIIPDESLNLIPFEALITKAYQSKNKKIGYHKLDYLLNDFNISYLYSSHLMTNEGRKYKESKFLGIAPSFENSAIPSLVNNQLEIQDINALYEGDALIGNAATYKGFLNAIGEYNIAHFATHAIFNDEIPMGSRIELADTSLYIYEIFSLSHKLQLAVMSACQTASGKQKEGEGVISLSRAFIQSGCPSVVASLWDVSDQKASGLLISFHEYLKEGNKCKNEALAESKRKYLSEVLSMNTHPFFWAGYIQIGDTDPISSEVDFWCWVLGIVFFILLILFLLRNKK